VRGVVSSAAGVLEHRHFDPFGNLFAGTMSQTDYGFTGEPFDSATGMLYLRARHYRPTNGTFVSRDPFEGTMSRPMSRNGYSWVEGRVADGRDASGRCALNSASTTDQRSQCSNAVNDYIREIERMYGSQLSWSSDLRALVARDIRYWNNLSYSQFVTQWNSSNVASGTTSQSSTILQAGLGIAGATSMVNPLPGPEDLAALSIALCAVALAGLASVGTVTLPLRQPYYFANTQAGDNAVPIPIPAPNENSYCEIAGSIQDCDNLQSRSWPYFFFEQAVEQVTNLLSQGRISERTNERRTTDNYCIGVGSHSQFYNEQGIFIGSVVCCPCCESYTLSVRCFFSPSGR